MSTAAVAVLPKSGSEELDNPQSATQQQKKQASPATKTVIVFDWDDTLLASSWLAKNQMTLDDSCFVPQELTTHLDQLQDAVIKLLSTAVKHGEVIIITNAQHGWVERSAAKFMPRVLPHVEKLPVFSARTEFEAECGSSPLAWKVRAFQKQIYNLYSAAHPEIRRNVISLGDSSHERQALHHVTASLNNTLTKSIKFVQDPSVEQLTRQVHLVQESFESIVSHEGHLDLMLTIQFLSN